VVPFDKEASQTRPSVSSVVIFVTTEATKEHRESRSRRSWIHDD